MNDKLHPFVPIRIRASAALKKKINEINADYVDPITDRHYGAAAVARCIVQQMSPQIANLTADEMLTEHTDEKANSSLNLLIPLQIIEDINTKVIKINNPKIGTVSTVEYLVRKGIASAELSTLLKTVNEPCPMPH